METKYISVLVENHEGVLARVASLFCQRGFNIDSLTVSATNIEGISRITVATKGDDRMIRQLLMQTGKLYETEAIAELNEKNGILRELLLIKVAANEENRRDLREITEVYKAKTVDLSLDSMVFELTGEPEKIDSFLKVLTPYRVIEMCRTGVTALERGDVILTPGTKNYF